MTASRPDLLPFALPGTVGLPYHGLCRNDALELPDATTMAYTQPQDGDTVVVRGPGAAATITRTAAEQAVDTARNYRWQNYALLSGYSRHIAGQQLGGDYHLYCSSAAAWRVETVLTSGLGSCTLTVNLVGLFGFFPAESGDYSMTKRKLAEYTWTPKQYDGSNVSGSLRVGEGSVRSFKADGSVAYINIGCTASAGRLVFQYSGGYAFPFCEHDCIKVTLSGAGSLTPGAIGTGISATITHYKWATDMIADYEEYPLAPGYRRTVEYHWVVLPNGSETHVSWTDDIFNSETYNGINDIDVYDACESTFQFGGAEYTSLQTWTAHFDGGSTSGTYNRNGYEYEWVEEENSPVHLTSTGGTRSIIYALLAYCDANFKTSQAIAATGDTYTCSAGETYFDNWSFEPERGEFAVHADDSVCWV